MSNSGTPPSATSPGKASETYTASCHCDRFRYTVILSPPLTDPGCEVIDCNCSICERNGYLFIHVDEKNITYDRGSDEDFSVRPFSPLNSIRIFRYDSKEGIAEGVTADIHVRHTQGCAPLLSKMRNELPCEELGSEFPTRNEVPQRARVP